MIEARGSEGDQACAASVQHLKDRGGCPIVDEQADRGESVGERSGLLVQARGEEDEVVRTAPVRLVQRRAVIGVRAEDGDFHSVDS